jgi:asparagine synthase (glutamine-hydrolysing)
VLKDEVLEQTVSAVPLNVQLDCQILTLAPHVTFDSDNYFIAAQGELYIDETKSCLSQFYEAFIASNKNIKACYEKLSGKFWLLIFDKELKVLHLFNDHFALKQCFYYSDKNALIISDSLKHLKKQVQVEVSISEQSLFNYMYFHCIPSPNTIFSEISKLQPSKLVNFDTHAKVQTEQLYTPNFNQQKEIDQNRHQACLEVIERAVVKNSTDSCGAFLSGGLDSSTVVGMLAKHQEAKTFSIGFDVKAFDETAYAKLTAKHFSTIHEVLYLKPEQAAEEFINVAQYFDEPFGNSSAMATYFCAKFAKESGVTTLLAGDGGDELFAGNERYAKQKIFEFYQNVPSPLQSMAKGMFCNTPLKSLPLFSKGASYINQAEVPLPDRFETYNFINQFGATNMFQVDFLESVDINQPASLQQERYFECSSEHAVDKMLYLDWKFTLADNDLVKVGRMCEMAGVDVRYPLLDKSVVDFSCSIPADIKLPGQKLRNFYKESCKGFLANETLTKSKHGFGLPFGIWLKENAIMRELVFDTLQSFKQRKIVKDSLIDDAITAHQSIHAGYYGELIWIMVVLELWLQK